MKLARTFHWKWPLIGLLWAGLAAPAGATEFAVPNAGSPYVSLDQLENDQILHLETGVRVTLEEMMDIVSSSRVIYVGETHDNLEAHRAQLEVLQRLYARYPGRVAVGMEMFRRSAQKELNRWVRGNLPETRFRTLFRENWGGGYRFYQSLFQFMQDKAIPLLGLKSSKPTETAFRKGDPAPEGVTFPELNEDDPFHKAYSMAIFGGHETHSKHLEKPYRMLLLWEETMAQTVGEFLQDPDRSDWKLVVLAGGFHVQYGFGIPKRAFRRVPHAYSIILPTVTQVPEELSDRKMDVEPVNIPLYSAHFAWKVPYRVGAPVDRIKLGVLLKKDSAGIRVLAVGPESNADRAGIRKDDVLLALDGKPIDTIEDLVERLQEKQFGDRTRIRLQRNSEELELEVVLRKSSS